MHVTVLAGLGALALGAVTTMQAVAEPRATVAELLSMAPKTAFFEAALYPEATPLADREIAASKWGAALEPSRYFAPFPQTRDGMSLIRLNAALGLAVNETSGRPYVHGLTFAADEDVEVRLTGTPHPGIRGALGHLSLNLSF